MDLMLNLWPCWKLGGARVTPDLKCKVVAEPKGEERRKIVVYGHAWREGRMISSGKATVAVEETLETSGYSS